MPQCQGIKTNGDRCERQDNGFIHLGATHLHFCSIHWGVYDRRVAIRRVQNFPANELHHRSGTCQHWIGTHWCGRTCEGVVCTRHGRAAEARRAARQQAIQEELQRQNRIRDITNEYRQRVPAMTWPQVVDDLHDNPRPELLIGEKYSISWAYFQHPAVIDVELTQRWQFDRYWRWVFMHDRAGNPPNLLQAPAAPQPVAPPAPPRNNLAVLAADRQNVHTRAVSEQTNKGLEKLLEEAKLAKSFRAPEWFAARWLLKSYGDWKRVVRTVNDMQRWYNTATCRVQNDWLYKNVLDGLYLLIRKVPDNDTKQEIYKRVYEECFESIDMCCEGHISRLCNVLVGFDETFAPPVPFGEILQNKMAAIYALEIETEEKVKQATAFFNEFAVPEAERTAWLEAF